MSRLDQNKVIVAMSGGVDSCVAALLLKEKGMDVIGVSMKTHEDADDHCGTKTCCAASDINDARLVCQKLDIPFYPLNFINEFQEKVIKNFVEEYSKGRTPNPCIQCNSRVKFDSLFQYARQLGAYYLATGHYARKAEDSQGRQHLLKAVDDKKDQSYFLFGLGQEELKHLIFPVGDLTKQEVRELAGKAGLKTAEKPESQDICFVPDQDYAKFIEKNFPNYAYGPGFFVDSQGTNLGEHRGVHAYTIGQRRGLGVATGERNYVTQIIPEENKVILGAPEDLLKKGMTVSNVRWVRREEITAGMPVEVKIRYRHSGVASRLNFLTDSSVKVDFDEPAGAITPGQAAVFYQGDEVLGGGFIEKGL